MSFRGRGGRGRGGGGWRGGGRGGMRGRGGGRGGYHQNMGPPETVVGMRIYYVSLASSPGLLKRKRGAGTHCLRMRYIISKTSIKLFVNRSLPRGDFTFKRRTEAEVCLNLMASFSSW